MHNTKSLIKLSLFDEMPSKLIFFLIKHFKEAHKVFEVQESEFNSALSLFKASGGNYRGDIYTLIHQENRFNQSQLNRTLDWLEEEHNQILSIFDSDYPPLLKKIPDPPVLLYLRGKRETISKPCIALVGSRKSTYHSNFTARSFAKGFANSGFCVVSGMARGIDSNAHIGALSSTSDMSTIAVMGCGLDITYPIENESLSEEIAQKGLLISEYALGTEPKNFHFPARNRIIAGLSLGVVVVEAAKKSGSLYTAELAMTNGRDVFAVPGSILTDFHKGCHNLIQQGAMLADTAEFVIKNIAWGDGVIKESDLLGHSEIRNAHHPLDSIGNHEFTISDLVYSLSMPIDAAIENLINWEIEGRITKLSNGNYQKAINC